MSETIPNRMQWFVFDRLSQNICVRQNMITNMREKMSDSMSQQTSQTKCRTECQNWYQIECQRWGWLELDFDGVWIWSFWGHSKRRARAGQGQGKGRARAGQGQGKRRAGKGVSRIVNLSKLCKSLRIDFGQIANLFVWTGPHFSAKSFLFDRASMGFSAAQQQNQTWNPRKTLKQLNFHRVFNGVLLLYASIIFQLT